MGTWVCPDTVDKAEKLSVIMQNPIMSSSIPVVLQGLIGDDDLFDRISDAVRPGEPDSDISSIVADTLEEWLSDLSVFTKPWDSEAVRIVVQAVDVARARLNADVSPRSI